MTTDCAAIFTPIPSQFSKTRYILEFMHSFSAGFATLEQIIRFVPDRLEGESKLSFWCTLSYPIVYSFLCTAYLKIGFESNIL